MGWHMYKLIAGIAFGLLLFGGNAMATCSSYPNTLTNGTTADAGQVMANFNCAALTSGSTLNGTAFTGTTTTSGNVGIGTTSPYAGTHMLTVDGNSGRGQISLLNSANTTQGGGTGLDGSANQIINGAAVGDFDIWTSQKMNFSANSGATIQLSLASSGNFGIGTASPSYLLHVNGTAYATGAAGALSDIRHKKDVASLEAGALNDVMRLRPVSFLWKGPKDDGMKGRQMGFIAQEVEQVLPTAVLTENNAEKTKGLKYNEITAVLTKALQEQQAEIVALKAANDNQVSEIGHLRTQLNVLER